MAREGAVSSSGHLSVCEMLISEAPLFPGDVETKEPLAACRELVPGKRVASVASCLSR